MDLHLYVFSAGSKLIPVYLLNIVNDGVKSSRVIVGPCCAQAGLARQSARIV